MTALPWEWCLSWSLGGATLYLVLLTVILDRPGRDR